MTFLKPGLALAGAVVLGLILLANGWEGPPLLFAGLLVVATLGWFAHSYVNWVSTDFVVTTDRLIYRHGVLAKHGIEIPLDRVNTVFFHQTRLRAHAGRGRPGDRVGG